MLRDLPTITPTTQADEALSALIAFTTMSSAPMPPTANNDLSDIFSSSPPSQATSPSTEPSDIPRLRSVHSTNGYRDGISASKARFIQEGFDEGFSLGAILGLRIGRILGVVEGVYAALHGVPTEQSRVRKLLGDAKRELKTENVFNRELFGEDGIWIYEVEAKGGEGETFEDVADAHPVVEKWRGVVEREVGRWGLDLRVLEGKEWEDGREDGGGWRYDTSEVSSDDNRSLIRG